MILIPTVTTGRASAKFVFTRLNTDKGEGIHSSVYIFVLGLLMSQYSLAGYDVCVCLPGKQIVSAIQLIVLLTYWVLFVSKSDCHVQK